MLATLLLRGYSTNPNNQISRPRPSFTENEYFKPQPVETNTIILTVKSLKEINSYGCDGISHHFLKDAFFVILFYLTCKIKASITTGNTNENMPWSFVSLKQATSITWVIIGPSQYYQQFAEY